jgi:site-specific DNA-methyltransferase (adenine-specific)
MPTIRVALSSIKPNPDNPRIIKDDKFRKLVESIRSFPEMLELRPIVVNADNVVLGGNMRLKACQAAGLTEVPIILASGLTDEQQREFIIKDNVGFGEWDWDTLANEWDADLLDQWGLDVPVVEKEEGGLTDPDEVPEPPAEPITKPGDLITLGRHRLLCGDSTDALHQQKLLGGVTPALVFTDPPYGVAYKAMRGGDAIKNDGTPAEAFETLRDALSLVHDAEAHFVCCDWRSLPTILSAMEQSGLTPKACIVWDKMRGVQNLDRFHKQHEFIVYAGPYGGKKTVSGDVWQFQRDFEPDHPTPKPVPLVARAIESATNSGAAVLDLFGGSGSTLVACQRTGRINYSMELDPKYCDVIVKRWEDFTGEKAVRENSEGTTSNG